MTIIHDLKRIGWDIPGMPQTALQCPEAERAATRSTWLAVGGTGTCVASTLARSSSPALGNIAIVCSALFTAYQFYKKSSITDSLAEWKEAKEALHCIGHLKRLMEVQRRSIAEATAEKVLDVIGQSAPLWKTFDDQCKRLGNGYLGNWGYFICKCKSAFSVDTKVPLSQRGVVKDYREECKDAIESAFKECLGKDGAIDLFTEIQTAKLESASKTLKYWNIRLPD